MVLLEKNEAGEKKFSEVRPSASEFRRFIRIMVGRWVVIFGIIIIMTLIITAAFAPQIAPTNLINRIYPTGFLNPAAPTFSVRTRWGEIR